MTRHLPISPWRLLALIVLLPCLCMASLGVATEAAHAAPYPPDRPLPHLVIQCPIDGQGWATDCESFRISGNPTLNELGEATAKTPYVIIACTIYRSGNANNCYRSYVPVGDQIITAGH